MQSERVRLKAKIALDPESYVDCVSELPARESASDVFCDFLPEGVLEEALAGLTRRERRILELRYGLLDGFSYTLEEIGKSMRLTRERIRQLENIALSRMRKKLRLRSYGTEWEFPLPVKARKRKARRRKPGRSGQWTKRKCQSRASAAASTSS
jgi:DNA-directed RNA polymerase sigma subunit (sigma70/sigma32)